MASRLLLNGETLRASVLAPETLMDLRDKVTGFIGGLSYNTDTVEEFLGQHLGAEKVSAGADFLEDAVAELLSKKIAESDIGAVVVGRSIAQLKETLGIGLHAMLFTGEAMSQIESAIAARINDLIGKMAPDVIKEEVQKLGRDIRSAPPGGGKGKGSPAPLPVSLCFCRFLCNLIDNAPIYRLQYKKEKRRCFGWIWKIKSMR